MRYISLMLALCLLAACTTPEQRARQQQMQEQDDRRTCTGYGLQPGSESFGQCLLEMDLFRRQEYRCDRYYPRYYRNYGYFMHP